MDGYCIHPACLEDPKFVRVKVDGKIFVVSSWDFGASLNSYCLGNVTKNDVKMYLTLAKLRSDKPDDFLEFYNIDNIDEITLVKKRLAKHEASREKTGLYERPHFASTP